LGLLASLPYLGALAALTLLPAVLAGWVHSTGLALQGQTLNPLHLLAPLRSPQRLALLKLGLIHAAGSLLLLELGDLIDSDFMQQWTLAVGGQAADDEMSARALVEVQHGLMLRAALQLPLLLLLWHAPVLVHRAALPLAQAIFSSALASLRNLGAFLIYGLSWIVADLLLSILVGVLLGLIGQSALAVLVIVPASMLFSAAFLASLHASVHGCLDFDEQP
ncbi:MAG: hypothetical protein RJA44_2763, partial [Pseudomonadota bacterium]